MPTSRPEHLSLLCLYVLELKPRSILDVGVGFGSKGVLFREYTDLTRLLHGTAGYDKSTWKIRIDGVEANAHYLTELHAYIYDNMYVGDIVDIVDDLPNYDLIYLGDIIEHFLKPDGERLLDKLKCMAKTIIIATPYKVTPNYGATNTYEKHRSQWGASDFPDSVLSRFGNKLLIKISKGLPRAREEKQDAN